MNSTRRLVAIMFTDIVGYTSLMGADENQAISAVTFHKKVIERLVPEYGGELIQFYGDGSLSVYPSVLLSLKCAEHIQSELRKDYVVPLRIGIHIGDVLFQEGSIYGDGVNLASRIESLGVAGSVLFSNEVFLKIKNNSQFVTQYLGDFKFKNVDTLMSVHALANDGLIVPPKHLIKGKVDKEHDQKLKTSHLPNEKSVAVLPFENQSSVQDHQFFITGIADEIRSQLLSINGLKVISRSSCVSLKDRNYSLDQIREELDVSYVLEGRVQVYMDQIKVNVDLSDTLTNKQVWSLTPMSQKLEDIFILQNNIANKVVNELNIALTEEEKIKLSKIPTHNQEAYNFYQKGQDLLHRGEGNIDGLDEALESFQKSIELDPEFSKAYVGLSDTYLEYIFWGRKAPSSVLDKALEACLKALELDNTMGECYGTLGAINYYKFQKKAAINFLNKAIELSPNYLEAYEKLAWINTTHGNKDEALEMFQKAHLLDPLSTKYLGNMGHVYYYSRDFTKGLEKISEFLSKAPDDDFLLWMQGYLYSGDGQYEKAIDSFLNRKRGTETNWMLGYSYSKFGIEEKGRDILNNHL